MQDSTDATRMGLNRTGIQMSPQQTKEMLEGMEALEADSSAEVPLDDPDGQALSVTRLEYIAVADPLGSVPAPATLKGAAKSGAKMLTGNRPQGEGRGAKFSNLLPGYFLNGFLQIWDLFFLDGSDHIILQN